MPATVNLAPLAKQRFADNNGVPLAGGKLFTYQTGTTTKQASYTDSTGTTPNTNPIILDSRGECSCWLDQTLGYKIVVAPSTDTDPPTNPIYTVDFGPITPSSSVAALAAALIASGGSALVGFLQAGASAILRTVQAKLRELGVSPTDFGADSSGTLSSSTALNLNSSVAYRIPLGTYKLSATWNALQSTGMSALGQGTGRAFGVNFANSQTGGQVAVHLGDPTETSPDGSHLNGVSLGQLSVTGVAGSGNGVQSYNAATYLTDVYLSSNGGWGEQVTKGWGSYRERVTWQANALGGFLSTNALNAVHFNQVMALSHAGLDGMQIRAGTAGTNSVVLTVPDLEGNANGLHLVADNTLKDITVVSPNCESNTAYGILQDGSSNWTGGNLIGGTFFGAGNGVSMGHAYNINLFAPVFSSCNLDISDNQGVAVFNPRLEGTAKINAGYVIAPLTYGTTIVPARAFAFASSDRSPVQSLVNGAYRPYEPILANSQTTSATGAVTVTVDLTAKNFEEVIFTAAATGVTVTITNDNSPVHSEMEFRFISTSTAAGTITFPANWKTNTGANTTTLTAARSSSMRFRKDGNGVWWAASALNAW